MQRFVVPALMLCAALSGCSSGGGVSTASILGTAPTPPPAVGAAPAATPVAPSSTPTDRAFLVGSVSARAVKCGYNFDAARVKSNFYASEAARGTPPDHIAQLEKTYAVAYNGVSKAAAGEADYCSERKTQQIKDDLARLLAGDFEPKRALVANKDDDSIFSGWFDGGSSDNGPSFGSSDWWEEQNKKSGH